MTAHIDCDVLLEERCGYVVGVEVKGHELMVAFFRCSCCIFRLVDQIRFCCLGRKGSDLCTLIKSWTTVPADLNTSFATTFFASAEILALRSVPFSGGWQ